MKVDPALCRQLAATAAKDLAGAVVEGLRALRAHWSEANATLEEVLADVDRLLGDGLPQAFGPETAAIILQALEYWNRDLSAPHAQIAEIRKMLGGGS